jgi:hypothetical protein
MAPQAKKSTGKNEDAAARAVERAQRNGESDADYKARMDELDAAENGGADPHAPNDDGLITCRAVVGFTHQAGVTQAGIDLQRNRHVNETDQSYQDRMKRLDGLPVYEPVLVRRGQKVLLPPDEAVKLARMGLVLVGDSDELLSANAGPAVLQEAGLVRVQNG